MELQNKLAQLKKYIQELGSLCIAFSGGVDSTFLLAVSQEVLGDRAMAVTVKSSMYTQREFKEAQEFAKKLGVQYEIIDADEYSVKEFVENSKDRCYYCKQGIFSKIKKAASMNGIEYVADGSNADDDHDFRPGMRAIKELAVKSPLKIVELTKAEIRQLSKERELPTWNKPSLACLASRIPYGTEITPEKLRMVEKGEEFLLDQGFKQFRVRYHGELARIEVLPEDRQRFFNETFMDQVANEFKKYGFTYVTLDLEGYRTGSMNEVLTEDEKEI